MKANEMDRYTFLSGLSILTEHPDGEWVRHADAMQVIQALEAKIKGMIERPTVEVVDKYEINLFGLPVEMALMKLGDSEFEVEYESMVEILKALGMEGDK